MLLYKKVGFLNSNVTKFIIGNTLEMTETCSKNTLEMYKND
jgi:hypothetical protein